MPTFRIKAFNGGISTGDKIGVRGSFYSGKNLDIHKNPNSLEVNPKTTKDSGTVVDQLILFMTSEGVNNDIYGLGASGGFFKKDSGTGTWTKIRTLAGGDGQGMGYFNGLIYFASGNNLGTYDPSTSTFNETYKSLDSATWHPMTNFLDKMIIGNGQYLAYIDGSGIWSSDILTLDNDYTVKTVKVVGGGNWLLAGTERADKTDCKLFKWDGFAINYNDVATIQENGINSITNNDAIILVNAGVNGHIYQYNGSSLVRVKTIPFIGNGNTALASPGSSCNYNGNPLFGIYDGTSTTVNRGVYSWTASEKNYSKVLNMEYTPSSGELTGITRQIGALFSEGENDLYIAWRDGSTYGVDLVDGSGAFGSAEYISLIYDASKPEFNKFFTDFKIRLGRVLRTGEKIDVYYDSDRSGTFTAFDDNIDFSSDGAIVEKKLNSKIRAAEIQFKLVFTNTNNTSPKIDSLIIAFGFETNM